MKIRDYLEKTHESDKFGKYFVNGSVDNGKTDDEASDDIVGSKQLEKKFRRIGGHTVGFWILLIFQLLLYTSYIWFSAGYLITHGHMGDSKLECGNVLLSNQYMKSVAIFALIIFTIYVVLLYKVKLESVEEYESADLFSFWGAILLPVIVVFIKNLIVLNWMYAVADMVVVLIVNSIGVVMFESVVKATLYEGALNREPFKLMAGIFLIFIVIWLFSNITPIMGEGLLCGVE